MLRRIRPVPAPPGSDQNISPLTVQTMLHGYKYVNPNPNPNPIPNTKPNPNPEGRLVGGHDTI